MDISHALSLLKSSIERNHTLDNDDRYEAVKVLIAHVEQVEKERIEIQNNERLVTCVFCGHVYPPGTPTSNHEALKAHVMECPNHPATIFKREVEDALRVALPDVNPEHSNIIERIKTLGARRRDAEIFEGEYRKLSKMIEETQLKFGAITLWSTLPYEVEQLFKEVRQYRIDENRLAQVVNWIDQADGTVFDHAIEFITRAKAKLSERKTIHCWLNELGIPREEDGKPICLLRRASLLLDAYRLRKK